MWILNYIVSYKREENVHLIGMKHFNNGVKTEPKALQNITQINVYISEGILYVVLCMSNVVKVLLLEASFAFPKYSHVGKVGMPMSQ